MRRNGYWAALGLLLATTLARADEWPHWLGPKSNGISEDPIVDKWPTDGPKKLWSAKVGRGFSSAVGVGGKIYFIGMQGSNDVLSAFDAETGKTLWTQSYPVGHKPSQPQGANPENGLPLPDATPTVVGDHIFTYGGGGDLSVHQTADGREVWRINVFDKVGASNLTWNAASSPLVSGNLVYVQGGDGGPVAVAVNAADGQVAWKAEEGLGGYAAPILIAVDSEPQLIIFGGTALYALNPVSGKTLWKEAWKTNYNVNAATPVFSDGHLFITTGYGHGCAMYTVGKSSIKEDWKGKELSSKFQPCILSDGRLYGNSGGILKCLKWPTKTALWSTRDVDLNEGGSFIIDGKQMISISENGILSLIHVEDGGANVVSKVELFHEQSIWSAPVIYHGKLYVKDNTELVCLDIRAK